MTGSPHPGRSGRDTPIDLTPDAFRALGHQLVDRLADFLGSIPNRPVHPGETLEQVRALLPSGSIPDLGLDPETLLDEVTDLVIDHSALNGHPDFLAFITSSAAPIGALGDLLASSVNPNLGGWPLSPVASEIERQTVQWIADFLGYPHRHGLMVSGGNMANLLAFWAARQSRASWDIRAQGTAAGPPMAAYVSRETHTWVQKAADLSGIGTDMIRWIDTDDRQRMEIGALSDAIAQDVAAGIKPFLVVGTAGTVSTGAVDPLAAISTVCRTHDLWFHVDGAYGAPAAALVELSSTFAGMAEADSIAVDPHKWLYVPLQAGCVLIKDMSALRDAFSYHPPYYPEVDQADDAPLMYYEYGLENSRGFRALKVWLAFRQIGRSGFEELIREDIALAGRLYDLIEAHPGFEAATQHLSITTFRYVPAGFVADADGSAEYLDHLNNRALDQLRETGVAYLSNAVVDGVFVMRACVVNFRTTSVEIDALPDRIAELCHRLDQELRPAR